MPTVAFVQSRNEGELKSPVRKTGMPCACSVRAAARSGSIAGRRTRFSIAITCAAVLPCFTHTGPYGAEGRCTFSIATTRPGEASTNVYSPWPPGGSISGSRETICMRMS